jgi:hypothetical protein
VVSAGASSVDSDALEEAAAEVKTAPKAEAEATAEETTTVTPEKSATGEVETSERAACELDGTTASSVFEAGTEKAEAEEDDAPDAELPTPASPGPAAVEATDWD